MSRISRQLASIIIVSAPAFSMGVSAMPLRDGQHDFDFNLGTWNTQVTRLLHPLSQDLGSAQYQGISVVSTLWGGRANVLVLEADGPAGHIEGLGLRLYNPGSHQWSLNWASSADGEFQPPMIGQFVEGHGDFFDQEVFAGKSILSKNAFYGVSTNCARFEQAFSVDGGRSWEINWAMTFTRTPADAPPKCLPLATARQTNTLGSMTSISPSEPGTPASCG